MKDKRIRQLVRGALMATVCLVLTRVVTIPAPTGYVNLGDCGVLLSAWVLGPWYGGLAAGVGSMLADLLSGYAAYAPATFGIKFVMAAAAAGIFKQLRGRGRILSGMAGAAAAEALMVLGYYLYECTVLGLGAAALASLPANLMQGAAGVVTGVLLISALSGIDRLLEEG